MEILKATYHKDLSLSADVTEKMRALYIGGAFRLDPSYLSPYKDLEIEYKEDGLIKTFITDSSYIANEFLDKYVESINRHVDAPPEWTSYISDIYCISKKPKEELKNIVAVEAQKNIDFKMFRALQYDKIPLLKNNRFPSLGQYGCSLSHYALVKKARDENLDRIMIVEDDCIFHKDFNLHMNQVVEDLKKIEWDIFYSHWNPYAYIKYNVLRALSHTQRVTSTALNHCWVINKRMYDRYIKTLDDVLESKPPHYPIINNQIYQFNRANILMTPITSLTTQCPKKSSLSLNMATTKNSEDFLK